MKGVVKDDLVPGWKCPCGCALQLGSTDVANEQRLIALLGPTPHHVDLRPRGDRAEVRKEPAEPTERGICRQCGAAVELAKFLADFLRLRNAKWPLCENCTNGRQADLWEAA